MNSTRKIIDGIRQLTYRPHELMSGTVVPGSVNLSEFTCSVQLTKMEDVDAPLANVMLNSVSENGSGVIRIPADGSNVVIGSVDGAGEYFLVQCSDLVKLVTTIGTTVLTITTEGYDIANGAESLTKILNDLITAITQLTVPTSGGPSGLPINSAAFTTIKTRLTNLLT